jgi:hypothetical protein
LTWFLLFLVAFAAAVFFFWRTRQLTALNARFKTLEPILNKQDELARLQVLIDQLERQRLEAQSQLETRLAQRGSLQAVDQELFQVKNEIDQVRSELQQAQQDRQRIKEELQSLKLELDQAGQEMELREFGLYEPKHNFGGLEQYKSRLELVYAKQKQLISFGQATQCSTTWTVDGSVAKGKVMTTRQLKLMMFAFNGECDAMIAKVKYDNVNKHAIQMRKIFEKINKLGETNHCAITLDYLEAKQDELLLVHEYQERKFREAEEQRSIREQMREEEKARRELERAQLDAERETERYAKALEKARSEVEHAQGAKQQKLQAEIERLGELLAEANAKRERAVSQAQLTRSGYVYVISNIGSFGEDIYKIGMTRRLDPQDRVDELGDASVPFPFDVHAMVFTQDAPGLENALHRAFEDRRVNLVNPRKEFFCVSLDEISEVAQKHQAQVTFTLAAEASQYQQSKSLRLSRLMAGR